MFVGVPAVIPSCDVVSLEMVVVVAGCVLVSCCCDTFVLVAVIDGSVVSIGTVVSVFQVVEVSVVASVSYTHLTLPTILRV